VNYVQRFHNRFRGGGLFDSHPLGSDAGGTPYVLADYVGSHLVEMKLRDIATMLTRVKKWKVTIDVEVNYGGNTSTLQTIITTPATVYERVNAWWDGSAFDYTGSTVEVADEQAINIYNKRPFEQIAIDHEPVPDRGTVVTIGWAAAYDYYLKTLVSADDAFKVTPKTPIYLPLNIVGNYFEESTFGTFPDTIAFSFWSNIAGSSIDHDKTDLTKATNAVNLKFMGVDVTSDLYWVEINEPFKAYDLTVSVTIEPAATESYWTYDGQFDEDTGAPV
jgi:hypothetical protein